jgi:hypothetical protein
VVLFVAHIHVNERHSVTVNVCNIAEAFVTYGIVNVYRTPPIAVTRQFDFAPSCAVMVWTKDAGRLDWYFQALFL